MSLLRRRPFWLPNAKRIPMLKSERLGFEHEEEQSLIEIGLFETGKGFTFLCPICGRTERNDQRMEPMCTGPSWTNDHAPEVMVLTE